MPSPVCIGPVWILYREYCAASHHLYGNFILLDVGVLFFFTKPYIYFVFPFLYMRSVGGSKPMQATWRTNFKHGRGMKEARHGLLLKSRWFLLSDVTPSISRTLRRLTSHRSNPLQPFVLNLSANDLSP